MEGKRKENEETHGCCTQTSHCFAVIHVLLSTCRRCRGRDRKVASSCVLVVLPSCGGPCRHVVFSCCCHGGCRHIAIVLLVSCSRLVVVVWWSLSLCRRRKERKKKERERKTEIKKAKARRSLKNRLKSVLASYDELFAMARSEAIKD